MPDTEEERAKRPTRMFRGAYGEPLDWRRFNGWNVFPRIAAYAADPHRTPFRLAMGDDDFGNLRAMNRVFVDQLAERGVVVPLEVDPGGHEWRVWAAQLPRFLQWLGTKLESHC